jgi:hypothetical protein
MPWQNKADDEHGQLTGRAYRSACNPQLRQETNLEISVSNMDKIKDVRPEKAGF